MNMKYAQQRMNDAATSTTIILFYALCDYATSRFLSLLYALL